MFNDNWDYNPTAIVVDPKRGISAIIDAVEILETLLSEDFANKRSNMIIDRVVVPSKIYKTHS